MTEREVESREPLEWLTDESYWDGRDSEYAWIDGADDYHWIADRGSLGVFDNESDRAFVISRDNERTQEQTKSLAQRLQDVLDGVPDQARAEGRAEALAEVVAKEVYPRERLIESLTAERDEAIKHASWDRQELQEAFDSMRVAHDQVTAELSELRARVSRDSIDNLARKLSVGETPSVRLGITMMARTFLAILPRRDRR